MAGAGFVQPVVFLNVLPDLFVGSFIVNRHEPAIYAAPACLNMKPSRMEVGVPTPQLTVRAEICSNFGARAAGPIQ